MARRTPAEVWLARGLIRADEAERARAAPKSPLRQAAAIAGPDSRRRFELMAALCAEWGIGVCAEHEAPDPELYPLVGTELMRRSRCVPLGRDGDRLVVALDDPFDLLAVDELNLRAGMALELKLALAGMVESALAGRVPLRAPPSLAIVAYSPPPPQSPLCRDALESLSEDGLRLGARVIPLAPAAFAAELDELEDAEHRDLAARLFPSYGQAVAALRGADSGEICVSADLIHTWSKQAFDRCFAGIELALRDEIGRLCAALAEPLADDPAPGAEAARARALAPVGGAEPPDWRRFLETPADSRPIGFYATNDALGEVFRARRFFAAALPAAEADALRRALARSAPARASRELLQACWEALTNPAAEPPLERGGARLFPPLRCRESALAAALPRGADLMGELARRVKSEALSLAPEADSGFYDRQQHALGALLLADRLPEARKLELGERLLKRLEDSFKAGLAQARESHIELQVLGAPMLRNDPPPRLAPRFPLEPLPTFYFRLGGAFAWLRGRLRALLGEARLWAVGQVDEDGVALAEGTEQGLARCSRLLAGLGALAADSLGLPLSRLDAPPEAGAARAAARAWLAGLHEDPFLARDLRVAAPAGETLDGGRLCWGSVGVRWVRVSARFTRAPEGVTPAVARLWLPVEQFASFAVRAEDGPPTRARLRELLDAHRELDSALAALSGGAR